MLLGKLLIIGIVVVIGVDYDFFDGISMVIFYVSVVVVVVWVVKFILINI